MCVRALQRRWGRGEKCNSSPPPFVFSLIFFFWPLFLLLLSLEAICQPWNNQWEEEEEKPTSFPQWLIFPRKETNKKNSSTAFSLQILSVFFVWNIPRRMAPRAGSKKIFFFGSRILLAPPVKYISSLQRERGKNDNWPGVPSQFWKIINFAEFVKKKWQKSKKYPFSGTFIRQN